MDVSICNPELGFCEMCCLPGACILYFTEKLSEFSCPSDYYPFLLAHADINDIIRDDNEHMRIQVVFLMKDKSPSRDIHILEVNMCLRRVQLLWRDGISPTTTGKNIYGHHLVNLGRKALLGFMRRSWTKPSKRNQKIQRREEQKTASSNQVKDCRATGQQ